MQVRWSVSIVLGGLIAASVADAQPKPLRCIDPDDNPVMVGIAPGKLTYCFETGSDGKLRCYVSELASGVVSTAMAPPPTGTTWPRLQPSMKLPKVTISATSVKVCSGAKCKTLTPKGTVDEGLGLFAAANDSGTLAALTSKNWIETFDLATGKRIAQFKTLSSTDCNRLKFAGDVLVVNEADCGTETSTSWLASKTGTKIAMVGGAKPIETSSAAPIKDTVWAFNSRKGDFVVVQDVKSGKVIKQIAIGGAATDGRVVMLGDGTWLALVFGGARAGDVAVVDVATDKVMNYPGKRCPP